MKADFPSERRFWFEPPFHDGNSALLHKQPDDIYRIDLQLGPGIDPVAESAPEKVVTRIRAMVGDRPFEVDWILVYAVQCSRLAHFVTGRVLSGIGRAASRQIGGLMWKTFVVADAYH